MKYLRVIFQCLYLIFCNSLSAQEFDSFASKPLWVENFSKRGFPDSYHWEFNTSFANHSKTQHVANSKDHAYVRRGNLEIGVTMDKPGKYKGTQIMTKGDYAVGPGKLEVRAKFSSAYGGWCAIWLRPMQNNVVNGEIDVTEFYGYMEKKSTSTFHLWGYFQGKEGDHIADKSVTYPLDVSKWHIYTLKWYLDRMIIEIDGKQVIEYTKAEAKAWPYDNRLYKVVLDHVWAPAWRTEDMHDEDLPIKSKIDWIRFYPLIKQ